MSISKNKYLLKNTVIFALGNFGTKFISFFLVPIYTNILTTSEYGTIDLIQTLTMIFVPLLTCNICEGVMRFSLDKGADHGKILNIGLCALLFATFSGLLLFPISKMVSQFSDYAVHLYLYTLTLAYSQMFMCYLRGREMLLQYVLGSILQTLCIAIFNIVFLIGFNRGINGYLETYILAYTITSIYAFLTGKAYREIGKFSIDRTLGMQMFKFSVVLIPNSFMWWIISSSDRIMLTSIVGAAANGLFAIAYKIPTLLSTVTSIFNQAWSYSAIREQGEEEEEKYNNEMLHRLVAIVSICAAGLMLVLKPFMQVYVGAEYYTAWRFTPILLLGFVFSTMGSFLATSYTVHKDSMGYLKSGMAGAIINVILNVTLIPAYGAMGAAIATSFSYLVVYLYRLKDTRKYLCYDVLKKNHLIGYALLLVELFTVYIESPVGYALLAIETLLVCFVHKSFFIEGICLLKILNQKIKNHKH